MLKITKMSQMLSQETLHSGPILACSRGTDPTPNESGFGSFGHFGHCKSGFGSQFKLTNPDLHGSGSDSQKISR
jgi:hypothetical protein